MGALQGATLEEAFAEVEVKTGLGHLFSLRKVKEDVTGVASASWLCLSEELGPLTPSRCGLLMTERNGPGHSTSP